jgi:SAM-dependent methyltransferase
MVEEGLEADLVLADMRKPLPLRDESFKGVLSTQVIHHAVIAGVLRAIQEIGRVLVSGGVAFVTVSGRKDEVDSEEIEPGTIVPLTGPEKGLPHHIFSEEALKKEFRDFRLVDVSVRAEGKVLVIIARKCHLSGDNGPGTFTQKGPVVFTQSGPQGFGQSGPQRLARLLKSGHALTLIQTLKRREHARQEKAYHGYP